MKKLVINDKTTNKWEGLWYNPEFHRYSSTVFNIKDLRDYKGNFRILAMKNKYHKQGDNCPSMVFKIVGVDTREAKELFEFIEEDSEEEQEELYTHDDVQYVINRVVEDVLNGYTDLIVSDYLPRY